MWAQPYQRFYIILIYPGIPIATAWVYDNLNLKLTKKENNISILQKFLSLSDISRLSSLLQNDLEPIVFRSYPEILRIKNRLLGFGVKDVLMSGSGSAVFGVCTNPEQAHHAHSLLKQELGSTYLVQTIQSFSEFLPEAVLNYP